nr:uncharacterized protein LOC107438629 [Parasteatoda tepidariorum]
MCGNGEQGKMKVKEKSQFANFFLHVLKGSLITGVPEICTAGTFSKKVIRSVVFIVSLSGFIYQSLKFMDIYWRHETVVDLKVTNDPDTELPAFTICNYNGLSATKICETEVFRDRCHESPKEIVSDGWLYEEVNELKPNYFPDREVYKEISLLEYKECEMFLQENSIIECLAHFTNNKSKYFDCKKYLSQTINRPAVDAPTISLCWTVNSLIGKADVVPINNNGDAQYVMMYVPNSVETPDFLSPVYAQMAIHDPRQIVNPFYEGFSVQDGAHETLRLKKVIKKLLPHPYDTNCIDYLQQWKSRGSFGPTNKKECIQECQKSISLNEYGCICQMYSMLSGNERRCDASKIVTSEMARKINDCKMKNCRPACYEESYEVTRDSGVSIQVLGCSTKKPAFQFTMILIEMEGMEVTEYTYRPKYDSIEIFSYIGGYIGMWLGISLMGIFNLFELIFQVLMYPLRNYTESRSKTTRMRKICVKHRNT